MILITTNTLKNDNSLLNMINNEAYTNYLLTNNSLASECNTNYKIYFSMTGMDDMESVNNDMINSSVDIDEDNDEEYSSEDDERSSQDDETEIEADFNEPITQPEAVYDHNDDYEENSNDDDNKNNNDKDSEENLQDQTGTEPEADFNEPITQPF
mgnify:CR=1 FL=1